ncbi:helix-turn-helix domain-containing protein [Brevibacillus dissolubilis]|uniref:helix-turn-helix domain-containing protein n=1 Tax=Brevibacillus dissolubilis TaxID=1844116 RepID=UPI001117023A|nr:helix-turn-helix transcriptional regulator [Brevibacillus dissolubilis]
MATFSQRLRELRQRKKYRQKDIADRLGITESAYGYYEQGRREPSYESLQQLAEIFDVSIDFLLGRTDEPTLNTKSPAMLTLDNPELGLAFISGGKDLSEDELEYLKESLEVFRRMKDRKSRDRQDQ